MFTENYPRDYIVVISYDDFQITFVSQDHPENKMWHTFMYFDLSLCPAEWVRCPPASVCPCTLDSKALPYACAWYKIKWADVFNQRCKQHFERHTDLVYSRIDPLEFGCLTCSMSWHSDCWKTDFCDHLLDSSFGTYRYNILLFS